MQVQGMRKPLLVVVVIGFAQTLELPCIVHWPWWLILHCDEFNSDRTPFGVPRTESGFHILYIMPTCSLSSWYHKGSLPRAIPRKNSSREK